MSSERRDRFLKLEQARPDGAAEPEPRPHASIPTSSTDRFRPAAERPLETADPRADVQPFTRCASCQMDSTVYTATCPNCGADLETPAQRDFNQRLWRERQAEVEKERRALAEREKERQREAAEQARARRELAEEMARQEKERVDASYGGGTFGQGPVARPGADTAGMRLLRLLPGTGWRIAAACAGIGIPLLLLLFGRGQIQLVGMMLLGLVIALFSPGRRRTGRWG